MLSGIDESHSADPDDDKLGDSEVYKVQHKVHQLVGKCIVVQLVVHKEVLENTLEATKDNSHEREGSTTCNGANGRHNDDDDVVAGGVAVQHADTLLDLGTHDLAAQDLGFVRRQIPEVVFKVVGLGRLDNLGVCLFQVELLVI